MTRVPATVPTSAAAWLSELHANMNETKPRKVDTCCYVLRNEQRSLALVRPITYPIRPLGAGRHFHRTSEGERGWERHLLSVDAKAEQRLVREGGGDKCARLRRCHRKEGSGDVRVIDRTSESSKNRRQQFRCRRRISLLSRNSSPISNARERPAGREQRVF